MKTPQQGTVPTHQELMEYVDGTLEPSRYREIETMVSQSRHLKNEVTLLRAMRTTIHRAETVLPSKHFTRNVMDEILPGQRESFWFRMAKNSSNVFAMVLVLSLIGIVLVTGPAGSTNERNLIARSIESSSAAYNSALESIARWSEQYTRPVGEMTKSPSGKFLLMGLAAFFIMTAVDELFGKKYFHARIKH